MDFFPNNTPKNNNPYSELAFEELRLLAEQGDAKAQFNLALRYKKGKDVEIDLSKAVEWYAKAAQQGLASAQNNLAVCYEHGKV